MTWSSYAVAISQHHVTRTSPIPTSTKANSFTATITVDLIHSEVFAIDEHSISNFLISFRFVKLKKGDSVLIIGGGPSGIDLVQHLTKIASRITWSQHKIINETKEERYKRQSILPKNVVLQDDVVTFTPTGAQFIDGSHETFSAVIFATG